MAAINSTCYLIFAKNDSDNFPMYKTSDGQLAVVVFRTMLTAQKFVEGRQKSTKWAVKELTSGEFLTWLRKAARRHQVSFISVDPESNTASIYHNLVPLEDTPD
jgi:hypothetical protein